MIDDSLLLARHGRKLGTIIDHREKNKTKRKPHTNTRVFLVPDRSPVQGFTRLYLTSILQDLLGLALH